MASVTFALFLSVVIAAISAYVTPKPSSGPCPVNMPAAANFDADRLSGINGLVYPAFSTCSHPGMNLSCHEEASTKRPGGGAYFVTTYKNGSEFVNMSGVATPVVGKVGHYIVTFNETFPMFPADFKMATVLILMERDYFTWWSCFEVGTNHFESSMIVSSLQNPYLVSASRKDEMVAKSNQLLQRIGADLPNAFSEISHDPILCARPNALPTAAA